MKYVFIIPIWALLFTVSILIGSIMYLWRFSERDFYTGTRFINENVIKFSDWFFSK
jgi:hypothetical protein